MSKTADGSASSVVSTVAPTWPLGFYAPRYYGTSNINVYRGPGGGGAVRVNGPNGSYVRWRR